MFQLSGVHCSSWGFGGLEDDLASNCKAPSSVGTGAGDLVRVLKGLLKGSLKGSMGFRFRVYLEGQGT